MCAWILHVATAVALTLFRAQLITVLFPVAAPVLGVSHGCVRTSRGSVNERHPRTVGRWRTAFALRPEPTLGWPRIAHGRAAVFGARIACRAAAASDESPPVQLHAERRSRVASVSCR